MIKKTLFILAQYCLPAHLISRTLGKLASLDLGMLTTHCIRWFIKRYNVNMAEARDPRPEAYRSFNAFFTRHLAPLKRPLAHPPVVCISPADGRLYASGLIKNDTIYQAKGKHYLASALLGSRHEAERHQEGKFACIYLSPKDYHRIHCPMDAVLVKTRFIPGKLYSVNPLTTQTIPGLFAKNERLVCHFETTHGPMVLVFVGAMIVGSIETQWSGIIHSTTVQEWSHQITYKQGDDLGCFRLGSTVIVLAPKSVELLSFNENQPLLMGQALSV